jgi:hypothetical protein
VNACREFLTNSARANSSRDETKEVSGVSSTIWQFGTRAARRATRKWCVSCSSTSLAKSSWDSTRSQLLPASAASGLKGRRAKGALTTTSKPPWFCRRSSSASSSIVTDHAHVDIDARPSAAGCAGSPPAPPGDWVSTTSEDTPRPRKPSPMADSSSRIASPISTTRLPSRRARASRSGPQEQLALGHGAVELQAAGGVEGLAAGDVVGEVEDRGQPDLLVRRHLVQVQAVENAGLDALGGLLDGLLVEERRRCVDEVRQEPPRRTPA